MPFDVTVERFPDYVRYNAAGGSSYKRFAGLVMLMAADIETFQDDRVLVDLRRVEGRLTTEEQQMIGELVAERLPLLYRLASLVPEGEITRNSEREAVRLGFALRVFDSESAALGWLLDGWPG
jgi:hypothetical protein